MSLKNQAICDRCGKTAALEPGHMNTPNEWGSIPTPTVEYSQIFSRKDLCETCMWALRGFCESLPQIAEEEPQS